MNRFDFWAMNMPLRAYIINRTICKYFKEYFGQLVGKTILEIGCGNGAGVRLIKQYFSPDKIIAMDLDERMVKIAKKNVKDPKITFELGDATKIKYQSAQFDAVFDFVTIHHIPSPFWKNCLQELYRVLKPEGKIFIYEASIESFQTAFGRILKIFTVHPYENMYRREEFISFLKAIDFKILKQVSLSQHFVIVAKKT